MPETLTLEHFGAHGATVLAAFERAFGFGWDRAAGEPQSAAAARQRLRCGIADAQKVPPAGHARAAELFAKIYRLREQLRDRFCPGGAAWRCQVAELGIAAAIAGQRLADLGAQRGLDKHAPDTSAALRQLVVRWDGIERQLDAAHYASVIGMTRAEAPQAEALAAIDEEVSEVCVVLRALKDRAEEAHLSKALERTHEATMVLKGLLDKAVVCAPPPPDFGPDPFRDYFNRLVWELPPIQYRPKAHSADAGSPHDEIPVGWLIVPRTDEERREVILCWFATFKRDFWGHLPNACRRDHPPPLRTGGPSSKNLVLDGIAAAMVLVGQVPIESKDLSFDGAKLFARVVHRTRTMLTRAGERGRLAVDPTGDKIPAESRIIVGETESVGDREEGCIRPPLFQRLAFRVEYVD